MTPPGPRARLFRRALSLSVLLAAVLASTRVDGQAAPSRSRWWDEVARVGSLLDEGKWQKAGRRAAALREEILRTSWREPDLGEVLAEIAFQAAVARANQGEASAALWEWHSALLHERARGGSDGLAGRDLSGYGRAAEVLGAQALRAAGEAPPGRRPVMPRPDRDWESPAEPEGFALSNLENAAGTREWPDPVVVEVLIDREGELSHPVLVSTWSHPVVVQWALDNLRRASPFRPARMAGQPVEVFWEVQLRVSDVRR